jgi:hypothetical protein
LREARRGYLVIVRLGTSIFLLAVGAILRYAVTASTSGISLPTVGLILMIAGIVGIVLSVIYMLAWAPRRGAVARERVVERDPYREPPAY